MDHTLAQAAAEIAVYTSDNNVHVYVKVQHEYPISVMRPSSTTTILLARLIVDKRCAMIKLVLPFIKIFHSPLNERFGKGIYRAGGFIHNKNVRFC